MRIVVGAIVLVLCCWAGFPTQAIAQERIVNGDFSEESQKTGWTQQGTWDGTQDVDGQADSGSLRIDNTGFGFAAALQCVNLFFPGLPSR